jgi:hypothetical protein
MLKRFLNLFFLFNLAFSTTKNLSAKTKIRNFDKERQHLATAE